MHRALLIMLTTLYLNSSNAIYIYDKAERPTVCCEEAYVLTGFYGKGAEKISNLNISIYYLSQDKPFPYDFMTECRIEGKLPLIVLRPTDYGTEGINELASCLAGFNLPVMVEIDCSDSPKYKDFYRSCADIIHLKAPKTAMVWGIGQDKANRLSTLYPGDEYVDWVALNLFYGADEKGIIADPYPLAEVLSTFEKSKPLMLNMSVSSYSEKGHKYYIYEAIREIDHLYGLADKNASIKAINYISRASSKGNALAENSPKILDAIAESCNRLGECQGIRLPLVAYKHNGEIYCDKGIIPTTDEYKIINNKRYYKIENGGSYTYFSP